VYLRQPSGIEHDMVDVSSLSAALALSLRERPEWGHWGIGALAHWDIGALGHWEHWGIGTVAHWCIGGIGGLGNWCIGIEASGVGALRALAHWDHWGIGGIEGIGVIGALAHWGMGEWRRPEEGAARRAREPREASELADEPRPKANSEAALRWRSACACAGCSRSSSASMLGSLVS